MARNGSENKRPPLNEGALREMALTYVGRFATSKMRLSRYLSRKVAERGWGDETGPDIEGLVTRFAELGYVDDDAYARMKGASMARRGLGLRRVDAALRADGIADQERQGVEDAARSGAWDAANIFARRKRIGPYAMEEPDARIREKQLAAFLRAGHSMDMARRWVDAAPGDFPLKDGE